MREFPVTVVPFIYQVTLVYCDGFVSVKVAEVGDLVLVRYIVIPELISGKAASVICAKVMLTTQLPL